MGEGGGGGAREVTMQTGEKRRKRQEAENGQRLGERGDQKECGIGARLLNLLSIIM